MEGSHGIMVEMPAKAAPTPQISVGAEAQPVLSGEQKAPDVEITSTHHRTERPETGTSDDEQAAAKTDEQKEGDTPKTPEEKKQDEIADYIEKFREGKLEEKHLDKLEQYLDAITNDENDLELKPKVVDKFAELTRLLFLLIKLFMLLAQNKPTYSGKDLELSETPPEGEEGEALTQMVYGESNKKSWKTFKESVEKIPEMSFGEFMSTVLDANARNTGRAVKLESPEARDARRKMLRMKLLGKMLTPRTGKPAAASRRA
ncbi:MAG TPA: hypothetical protein VLF20_06005 [Patescibacteria group bacterium]|nr:hypothetical protein [Patescibacteria group bacterium]